MTSAPRGSGAPRLSIVMPARDVEGWVERAIRSLGDGSEAGGDGDRWELLVVDDGSRDGTARVVSDLAAADPRIRLIQGEGKGVSAARNLGLELARGEIIGFLDADDFVYPGAVARRLEALDAFPGLPAVHCETVLVDEGGRELGVRSGRCDVLRFDDMRHGNLHLNSIFLRREALAGIRFDPSHANGEDWLFLQRVLRTGVRSLRVHGCQVAYRQRSGGTVARDFEAHEDAMLRVIDVLCGADPGCPRPARQYARGLGRRVGRRLRRERRFGLLVRLILEGDLERASCVFGELPWVHWSRLSPLEAARILISASARFYTCSPDALPERLGPLRPRFRRFVEAHGGTSLWPGALWVLRHPGFVVAASIHLRALGERLRPALARATPQ